MLLSPTCIVKILLRLSYTPPPSLWTITFKTGHSSAVKTMKYIQYTCVRFMTQAQAVLFKTKCGGTLIFSCFQSRLWAWMNLWTLLDVNRCTCGMLGLWALVACTIFSLSLWQFFVKMQLGLSVKSCVYTVWPQAKIRTKQNSERKSLCCGCLPENTKL